MPNKTKAQLEKIIDDLKEEIEVLKIEKEGSPDTSGKEAKVIELMQSPRYKGLPEIPNILQKIREIYING